jgi:hypothetical protein
MSISELTINTMTIAKFNAIVDEINLIYGIDIGTMITQVENMTQQLAILEANFPALSSSINLLLGDLDALEITVSGIISDYNLLNGRINNIFDTTNGIHSDLPIISQKISGWNALVNQLLSDYNILDGNVDTLSSDMNTAQQDIIDLQGSSAGNMLSSDITMVVGTGETYTTLVSALAYCKTLIPCGFKVTLSLKSGFVLSQQIFLSFCDLSFVDIVYQYGSTVSVLASGMTASVYSDLYAITLYPLFYGLHAKMPNIKTYFELNSKFLGSVGMYLVGAYSSAKIYKSNVAFAGFGYFARGLFAHDCARINAVYSSVGEADIAVDATAGGEVDISKGRALGTIGLSAGYGGIIVASETAINYIMSTKACVCTSSRVVMDSSTGGNPIDCLHGGIVQAYNTTGTFNLAKVDTVYSDGIIFR